MKYLLTLLSFILLSNLQAMTCETIGLDHEREKIKKMKTFSKKEVEQFIHLKSKLKRAQILFCMDQLLEGHEVSFSESDLTLAKEILEELAATAQEPSLLENIDDLKGLLIF